MEQNKEEYYCNFKCYNEKGQRLALFGRLLENGKLEVFKLRCSKQDQFKKELAYRVYNEWLKVADNLYKKQISTIYGVYFNEEGKLQPLVEGHRPTIELVTVAEENKPLWTFNQHCKNSYYHKSEQTRKYKEEILTKGKEKPIILSHKRSYKMDKTY